MPVESEVFSRPLQRRGPGLQIIVRRCGKEKAYETRTKPAEFRNEGLVESRRNRV
jgi:hypothetical protein